MIGRLGPLSWAVVLLLRGAAPAPDALNGSAVLAGATEAALLGNLASAAEALMASPHGAPHRRCAALLHLAQNDPEAAVTALAGARDLSARHDLVSVRHDLLHASTDSSTDLHRRPRRSVLQ